MKKLVMTLMNTILTGYWFVGGKVEGGKCSA